MTNLETNIKKEIIAFVAVLHLKRGNQSAQWFRRRSLKCEKFTDNRRRMPSDGNSSHGPDL
jgi:hypothetical protein